MRRRMKTKMTKALQLQAMSTCVFQCSGVCHTFVWVCAVVFVVILLCSKLSYYKKVFVLMFNVVV